MFSLGPPARTHEPEPGRTTTDSKELRTRKGYEQTSGIVWECEPQGRCRAILRALVR